MLISVWKRITVTETTITLFLTLLTTGIPLAPRINLQKVGKFQARFQTTHRITAAEVLKRAESGSRNWWVKTPGLEE